MMMMHFFSYR